jgi:hypothetical protein
MMWLWLSTVPIIAAVIAVLVVDVPVSRERVQRFADRQGLAVTADNAAQVVAYLATVRRWRTAGLVAALAASTVVDLRHQRISVSFTYLLAGWFAGAVVAEARVAGLPDGLLTARRAASLQPRVADRYAPPVVTRAMPLAVLAVALAAVGHLGEPLRLAWPVGIMAVVSLVVWATIGRILGRPQPVEAADVLAADDAIRSRSVHLVIAGGSALLLYTALMLFVGAMSPEAPEVILLALLVGMVAVPCCGGWLATRRWVVRPADVRPVVTGPAWGAR